MHVVAWLDVTQRDRPGASISFCFAPSYNFWMKKKSSLGVSLKRLPTLHLGLEDPPGADTIKLSQVLLEQVIRVQESETLSRLSRFKGHSTVMLFTLEDFESTQRENKGLT